MKLKVDLKFQMTGGMIGNFNQSGENWNISTHVIVIKNFITFFQESFSAYQDKITHFVDH